MLYARLYSVGRIFALNVKPKKCCFHSGVRFSCLCFQSRQIEDNLFPSTCSIFHSKSIREYSSLSSQEWSRVQNEFLSCSQVNVCLKHQVHDKSEEPIRQDAEKKLSLLQKFKAMYRDYWYVLVPVHVFTSAIWYGSFYYMARTGVDIAALAEMAHFSEEIIEKIRRSSNSLAGHLAIAYLLYKIFTPLRYTVTIGGTTVSINYLKKWGWIKPIPKKEELQRMFDEKKLAFRRKGDSLKERHESIRKAVMAKLASKKRMKKTSDFMRRMLGRKRKRS